MLGRLEEICREEKVNCNNQSLSALIKWCNGDMRRAITTLQSCARFKNDGEEITENDIIEVTEVSY